MIGTSPPHADLILRGGLVAAEHGTLESNIVVHEGRVRALLTRSEPLPSADLVLDVAGQIVLPGGVDPHCHVGQVIGEYHGLDDYRTAGIAALCGGTTTIIDFAIPVDGETPLGALRKRIAATNEARCDVALHGCIVEWTSDTASELDQMVLAGIRTVKLFTTYRDAVMADYDTILKVMRALQAHGGLAYVHAEADHIIWDAQGRAVDAGHLASNHLPETRPEPAEVIAVEQVLSAAKYTGSPVYLVHQSTAEAVERVRAARAAGQQAFSETCPHYLSLDESVYLTELAERYTCCPPLRSRDTVTALGDAVIAGGVDTLGSDHSCYSLEQKHRHANDLRNVPNGLPGVELRLPRAFTTLVVERGMSLDRFARLFATNPAILNGLPDKGVIRPGADADLVVLDPDRRRVVRSGELHMATDYVPYEGQELAGWPTTVVAMGRVVLDADGFHDPGPVGRHLPAAPIDFGSMTTREQGG